MVLNHRADGSVRSKYTQCKGHLAARAEEYHFTTEHDDVRTDRTDPLLIHSLRTIIEEKTAHEMVFQEQVDYLTKKLFGSSSEKTLADIPGQLNLFNEAVQDPELPEEDCSQEPRPRKKKTTHAELFKGLKVHKEVVPLNEEDNICPVCGAAVSRTLLANWIIYSAEHYFRSLYDYFHRQLLLREFLMADETRVQVLKEPGRSVESQSFMWLYRTGEDGLPVILLYGYTPTRSGDNAADFFWTAFRDIRNRWLSGV